MPPSGSSSPGAAPPTAEPELYVGLMTGTSVDAVDAVLVEFSSDRPTVVATCSFPLPNAIIRDVHTLVADPCTPAREAWRLDTQLADVLAGAVDALLAETVPTIDRSSIVAIGSHGQTVWHEPNGTPPFTVQLGDPSRLAQLSRIRVVADFRRRDIAAGGQAAPLAPALHAAVFSSPSHARAVLNLGGIANLTALPASATGEGLVTGFDTGPANTLLDAWARRCLGQPMDAEGAFAQRGEVDEQLLDCLLSDAYFTLPAPKSTGREAFNMAWLEARAGNALGDIAPCDVMRTLIELSARTVADAARRYAADAERLFVCGGGARNPVLMAALAAHLAPTGVGLTSELGIDPDWVEAITFAWLARQTIRGLPGNLPSVTGASAPVVLGGVYSR